MDFHLIAGKSKMKSEDTVAIFCWCRYLTSTLASRVSADKSRLI